MPSKVPQQVWHYGSKLPRALRDMKVLAPPPRSREGGIGRGEGMKCRRNGEREREGSVGVRRERGKGRR